ncbi:RHS repeat domain-containing protein [Aquimarina brevivitae]|nr:RHS repeat-associated core domain-containing protein [Aquimarina brevivitae]
MRFIHKYIVFFVGLALQNLVTGQILPESTFNYDDNGNLIVDTNKNIVSITYNILNLPEEITFSDGRKIRNTYDASGNKLSQKVILENGSQQLKKDYVKAIIYSSNSLEFIHTTEGYVEPDNDRFIYVYQYKDLVKNIRSSFSDTDRDGHIDTVVGYVDKDGDGDFSQEVKEEKDYYPFGLKMLTETNVIRGRKHEYGFAGKEEIEAFDLDWNDFGARMYESALGRWHSIDPLAEKYLGISIYSYTANNPIKYYDPDGMRIAEGSIFKWKIEKTKIIVKRALLQVAEKAVKATNQNKALGKNLSDRVAVLGETISNLNTLEKSSQVYSLNTGKEENGVSYDLSTGNINIDYTSTATFAHETRHAGHFETRRLGFDKSSGNTVAQDTHDEVDGFQSQWAYDPSSLPSKVNSKADITPKWVQLQRNPTTGDMPYRLGGSANTGQSPLNIDSTRYEFIKAYPHQRALYIEKYGDEKYKDKTLIDLFQNTHYKK